MRFPAIEGLRGWLAWAVVADHLAYWSDRWGRLGSVLRELGYPAVMTFCAVSGFVICHLILTRPEPYLIYITRRFFRLFPLFAVTCILGYFAYQLQVQLPDPDFYPEFMTVLRQIVEDTDQHFWTHVAAHVSMLYGLLPQDWLPSTDVAFSMPAWSISLEWQFYLIAPLVIWLLVRQPRLAPTLIVIVVLLQLLFHQGWFGTYNQPAMLPATGVFFAVGIAGRLLYPMFEGRSVPWLASALENPVALYLGSRSYSTYLGHFLVVVAVQHVATRVSGTAPQFLALAAMVVPATLLFSELLYRTVELPGIRLGTRLCHVLHRHHGPRGRYGHRDLRGAVLVVDRERVRARELMSPDRKSLFAMLLVATLTISAVFLVAVGSAGIDGSFSAQIHPR